jgi:DNA repair exonuclease SbcCD nuclease subunit
MPGLKLLHIADVHFGKKGREGDILKQLEKVVEIGLKEKVDLLLIGGDLFDNNEVSQREKELLKEALSPLKERVVAICGNHDFQVDLQGLPFYKRPTPLRVGDDLLLYLFPFYPEGSWQKVVLENLSPERQAPCQVVLCHASYTENPRVLGDLTEDQALYWPFSRKDIEGLPIDYLALGHYHNGLLWEEKGILCGYPGSIEPLSFKEEGPRKAFLLLWEGKIRVEEIELGSQVPHLTFRWTLGFDLEEEELFRRLRALKDEKGRFQVILSGFVKDRELFLFKLKEFEELDKFKFVPKVIDYKKVEEDLLLRNMVKLLEEHLKRKILSESERKERFERLLSLSFHLLGEDVD